MAVPAPSAIRATDLEDSALVRRAPNHQFWYQHDPSAGWEVGKIGEKSYLLPVLGVLSMTPGVNLVHTRQKGADLNTVWTDAVAAAPAPFPALDVLVLCQGTVVYRRGEFERAGWDHVMAVNLDAVTGSKPLGLTGTKDGFSRNFLHEFTEEKSFPADF